MKKIPFLVLSIFVANNTFAEEVLHCSSELATGFVREDGNWREREFNPSIFAIEVGDNFEYFTIEGRKFNCHTPYDNYKELLVCERNMWANGLSFRYSTKTKRFIYIRSSVSGYIENKEITDMEIMYAGKCGELKHHTSPLP